MARSHLKWRKGMNAIVMRNRYARVVADAAGKVTQAGIIPVI